MDLVSAELPARTLVVATGPGKATNRALLADGERGLIGGPVSLPTLREGIERLCELIESQAAPETVIAIEATGSLHLPWVAELERRLPGSTRLFAPSETQAARTRTGCRPPIIKRRTSRSASRRSVLTRSWAGRSIFPGAATTQGTQRSRRARARPKPVGPAS
jgi:hypothetical protein